MEAPMVIDPLELTVRNNLQKEVMKQMLGSEHPPFEDQADWAIKYAKKISELIDWHEHDEIRDLALDGNYEESAKLLIELLEE